MKLRLLDTNKISFIEQDVLVNKDGDIYILVSLNMCLMENKKIMYSNWIMNKMENIKKSYKKPKKFLSYKRIKKSRNHMSVDDVIYNDRKYDETSEQYEKCLHKDYEEYEKAKN